MTLTIKEPLELNNPTKPGSHAQNSANNPNESPRSNPVCLEVPVTVRSLPGENGNAPGAAGPIREDGRTVIVFDNGAVLRLSNTLPAGQSVILSNAQGRDVVCKVAPGRNLPTVKGYIEVEFMEPVNDFWRIHQAGEQASIPPPPAPALAVPPPAPVVPLVAPPAPPVVVSPAKEEIDSLGSAPTFEDIAGLVRMSPSPITHVKMPESSAQAGATRGKDESTNSQIEAAKPVSSISASESFPVAREFSSVQSHRPASSGDVLGRTMLASGQSVDSSTTSSRGPLPLILGGAALVLAGFGAAYFFMHHGAPAVPEAPAVVSAQPSPSAPGASSSVAEPPASSQPVVAEAVAQPLQASPSVSAISEVKASPAPVAENLRRSNNAVDAKQPDQVSKQRQQAANFKMNSLAAPRANSAKLPEGAAPSVTDVGSATSIGGAPTGVLSASVARSENQPAAPAAPVAFSAPSSAKVVQAVRQPVLINSTRPIYPPMAKQSKVQGTVVVAAEVDAKGNITGVKVVSGPMLLRDAALDSVKRWKYSPALVDGKPSAAQVSVAVDFHLN